MVAVGKRTDDGSACTLLAVSKTGGVWALYSHGGDQLGVRLPADEAVLRARVLQHAHHSARQRQPIAADGR